jgi:ATP-grasp ribosomal peptide maturase
MTDRPSVLIVSARDDWSAAQVADQLAVRGVRWAWLDPGDFPQRVRLTGRLVDTGWAVRASHDTNGTVDVGAVRAVFYRRPGDFRMPAGMSGPEQRFARAQARIGVGGLLASLPARWINHPSALADHEYKPRQLALASAVGLAVPATVITNDPGEVRAFADDVGELIVKPLADPLVAEAGTYTPVWTRRLTAADLADLAGVETTAHLFQAWINKRHEVRLIAVGHTLFPVAIHAGSHAARIDWRADYDALRYEPTECPTHVAEAVHHYLTAASLIYGAFDFAVDHDGVWWLLECNAAGQWGWLAEECDLPIAAALADNLIGATT